MPAASIFRAARYRAVVSRVSQTHVISRLFCVVLVGTLGSACAPLDTSATKRGNRLPARRLPPDAVVLDVAFVRFPASDAEKYEAIWNAADEQALETELRRELATNGLRVGVFGQQVPAQLRELLDEPPKLAQSMTQVSEGDLDLASSRQHLPVRAGHRTIITASGVLKSLPVLLSEEGTVRGHQLQDARCIFSLKAYPQGDGGVKLAMTPEIEHGESKTRWGGTDGMLIHQVGQDRLVLDRLRWEAALRPGQSLLISGSPEIKGLGESFFSQKSGGQVERRMLVVRFSQAQIDDLFLPEQTSAPLATPGQ
jgi:hypothetical protein